MLCLSYLARAGTSWHGGGPCRRPTGAAGTTRGRDGRSATSELPSKRFQARYVGPDGVEHRAPFTFTAKGDADRWLANEQVKITQGTWRPPQAVHEEVVAKVVTKFGPYSEEVLERRDLRDTTLDCTGSC